MKRVPCEIGICANLKLEKGIRKLEFACPTLITININSEATLLSCNRNQAVGIRIGVILTSTDKVSGLAAQNDIATLLWWRGGRTLSN